MLIKPVLTEKSMAEAKKGVYTFIVNRTYIKREIKNLVEKLFKVHVKNMRIINHKGGVKRNFRGRSITLKAYKKVMLRLAEKETIDLFEEKKA